MLRLDLGLKKNKTQMWCAALACLFVAQIAFAATDTVSEAEARLKARLAEARAEAAGLPAPPVSNDATIQATQEASTAALQNDDEMMPPALAKTPAQLPARKPLAHMASADAALQTAPVEEMVEEVTSAPVPSAPVAARAVPSPVVEKRSLTMETTRVAKKTLPTPTPTSVVPTLQSLQKVSTKQTRVASRTVTKSVETKPVAAHSKLESMPASLPPITETEPVTSSVPVIPQASATQAGNHISMNSTMAEALPVKELPAPAPLPVELPPSANRVGAWTVRTVNMKSAKSTDAFCLMEAEFDNGMLLLIGQRADGFATLGVNYGLEMLQLDKPYRVTIRLDRGYEEDFTGYAESAKLMIAQLGRKPTFFGSLANARELTFMMPGVGSVFTLGDMGKAKSDFAACLTSIGGALQMADPVPNSAMPTPITAPIVDPVAPVENTPVVQTEDVTLPPAAMPADDWTRDAKNMLSKAGLVPQRWAATANQATFQTNGLEARVRPQANGDIIDITANLIDQQEQNCGSSFTSQLGVPDTFGGSGPSGMTLQPFESKCPASKNKATVSSGLVTQTNGHVLVWEWRGATVQSKDSMAARDRLQNALVAPAGGSDW